MREEYKDQQRTLISRFYETHRNELVGYTKARLGNIEESEDAVQDAFIRMLRYTDMICESTIKSFAFRITQNIINDRLRHKQVRQVADQEMMLTERALQHCDAERIVREHELNIMLYKGISQLSPACRKVYTMSLLEELSANEIAEQLGLSKRTIETQLLTSRKQIRHYMAMRMNA